MGNSRILWQSLKLLFMTFVLFVMAGHASAGATPAFVQERDNQVTSGKTSGVTLAAPTVAGNLIVAYLIWDNIGTATVSDSLGNSYASAGAPTRWGTGNYSTQIFYVINLHDGVNTVTAMFSTAVNRFAVVYVHEYSGIRQTAPLDVTVAAAGSSGSLSSGSVTTTNDVDLLFAGAVSANFVTSSGPGYISRSTAHGNMTEDRVVSVKGTYSATASNSSGAWGIQMVAFRGASISSGSATDTTAPTVPTRLSATTLSASQIKLSWTASTDPDNTASQISYRVYRGGTLVTTTSAGASSWTDSGLAASTSYSYTVAASDPAGNNSTQTPTVTAKTGAAVTQDTQAPTVSISSLSNNQTVSGTLTVSANAADNVGVVGVQFRLDGNNLGAEVTTSPYKTAWSTSQTKNGSHSLTAVARDAAGNKTTSSVVTVTVSNSTAMVKPYTTNFPLTQNPISENSYWINGKTTGLDWSNVETTPGLAFASATSTSTPYNDPTAVLAGTWGSNQKAQAVVRTVNQNSSVFEEVELRLRTTITAHSITGYEFNFRATSNGTQYVQIVRWNGPFGSFTVLDSKSGPGLHNGDVVSATAVGTTLTSYINGVQIVQVTDSTFSGGSPGMGFYNQGGTLADNSDFGFTSFTATDNLTGDSTPPSAPANLAATVYSSSQINLTWGSSTDNVGVVGYRIYRNSNQLASTATTSYSDQTAVPGVQYTYTVLAYDASGNISPQSSPVIEQTSPVSDATPPSIPTNLKASNMTSSSLTLTWIASTDNVGVAGYRIYRNGTQVATTSSTSYTNTGLAASTSYTYTVAAYDSSSNISTQSLDVFVTTGAGSVAPSFIQEKSGEVSTGTSVSVALNSLTQAGNTIIVYVIWNTAGSVVLSDSRGDTFVNVGAPVSWGSGYSAQTFYASGIAGGTDTVKATFRAAVTSFGVLYAHEYSGISATNPVDVTASATGSSGTLSSGAATTTSANDLIFGAGVSDNMVTAAGSGFIARDLAYGNITEDRIAASIGAYAATATQNGQSWGMQMVAFRPAQ
jgi:chitodextrinase